jgi:hypothetical protein
MSEAMKEGLNEKSEIKVDTKKDRSNPGEIPDQQATESVSRGGKKFTIKH